MVLAPVDEVLEIVAQAYNVSHPVAAFSLNYRSQINQDIGIRTASDVFICKIYSPIHSIASIQYEHKFLSSKYWPSVCNPLPRFEFTAPSARVLDVVQRLHMTDRV